MRIQTTQAEAVALAKVAAFDLPEAVRDAFGAAVRFAASRTAAGDYVSPYDVYYDIVNSYYGPADARWVDEYDVLVKELLRLGLITL